MFAAVLACKGPIRLVTIKMSKPIDAGDDASAKINLQLQAVISAVRRTLANPVFIETDEDEEVPMIPVSRIELALKVNTTFPLLGFESRLSGGSNE